MSNKKLAQKLTLNLDHKEKYFWMFLLKCILIFNLDKHIARNSQNALSFIYLFMSNQEITNNGSVCNMTLIYNTEKRPLRSQMNFHQQISFFYNPLVTIYPSGSLV